jgi:hypothetical protein
MTIGVLAMQDHIARALREDPLSQRLQERIARAYGEIYSPALLPRSLLRPEGRDG